MIAVTVDAWRSNEQSERRWSWSLRLSAPDVIRVRGLDLVSSLKEGGRGGSSGEERHRVGPQNMAGKLDAVGKPRDWDKAMSAAYLQLFGLSQEEAAKGAGVGERTLQRWEVSDWWPKACEAARDQGYAHQLPRPLTGVSCPVTCGRHGFARY